MTAMIYMLALRFTSPSSVMPICGYSTKAAAQAAKRRAMEDDIAAPALHAAGATYDIVTLPLEGEAEDVSALVRQWRAEAAAHPETYNTQHDPEVCFYKGKAAAADELDAALE